MGVEESLKGAPRLVQAVRTASSSAACGITPTAGERILVFARRDGRAGAMTSNLCSGTRPLDGPVPDSVRRARDAGIVACGDAIDWVDEIPDGLRPVAGAAALPAGPLTLDRSGDPPHFAEQGILALAGRGLEVVVPRPFRDRVELAWGSAARAPRIVFSPCPWAGFPPWLAYAGGYTVQESVCVPIRVVAERTRTIRVGVGQECADR